MAEHLDQSEVDEILRQTELMRASGQLASEPPPLPPPIGMFFNLVTDARPEDISKDECQVLRCPYPPRNTPYRKRIKCNGFKPDNSPLESWCWYYAENTDSCLHKFYNRNKYTSTTFGR
jgi:hypothetical protein